MVYSHVLRIMAALLLLQVYLPGQALEEGEELVHDSSAYHLYHAVSLLEGRKEVTPTSNSFPLPSPQAQTGAPCLSFDILRDSLGNNRSHFPMTAYLVAGTQSAVPQQNFIILMKMSQLKETAHEGEEEGNSECVSAVERL